MPTGVGFLPVKRNGRIHWLSIEEGETLDQTKVACMHSSSLQFNLIMSEHSPTTHILIKTNLFPNENLAHACHMLSARWSFILSEWELASNDGKWISSKRVKVEDTEMDILVDLVKIFENVDSVTLYYFQEVEGPVERLDRIDMDALLNGDLTTLMFDIP